MNKTVLFASILLIGQTVWAEEEVKLEDLPDAPPPPSIIDSGETLEPEVTIIRKDEEVIEEYRVNGNLYMVKITPVVGPSYYLIDKDGDGQMETNMSEIYEDFTVPQWVIFSW